MKGRRSITLGFFLVACLVATGFAAARAQSSSPRPTRALADSGCQLNSAKGNIKHVIYIVFDNVHFDATTPTSHPISSRCRTCSISSAATGR